MGSPAIRKVCIPFFRKCDKQESVFVSQVFIQVISYSEKFFWFHISEGLPQSCFGPCAMAICTSNTAPTGKLLCSSLLCSTGSEGLLIQNLENEFCLGLARQLASKTKRVLLRSCSVYVNCIVSTERKLLLLGALAGGKNDASVEFGGLVFKECMQMIEDPSYGSEREFGGSTALGQFSNAIGVGLTV